MCLPLLIFPCTIKSRSSLLAPADTCGFGKRAVKRLWCGGGGGAMSCAEMAKPIEVQFGLLSQVGPENIYTVHGV